MPSVETTSKPARRKVISNPASTVNDRPETLDESVVDTGNQTVTRTEDQSLAELLNALLIEQRITNLHLSAITDEVLTQTDIPCK